MLRRELRRWEQRMIVSLCTAVIGLGFQAGHAEPTFPADIFPEIGIAQVRASVAKAAAKPGLPVRLSIPAIKVEADIRDLGLTSTGKLEAPAEAMDVGWYRLGPRPGDTGSAVLDGHLTLGRGKGIFWNLRKLKPGDVFDVTDDAGVTRQFRVRKTEVYPVKNAPMQEIFAKNDGRYLNLITCAGVWRREMNHYDKRLIVYSEAVEGGVGTTVVKAERSGG